MLAATFNITLDRAADYALVLTLKNYAGGLVTVAADEFHGQVRESVSKKKIVDFTFSITGLSAGEVKISLSETDTKLLRATTDYEYDIFRVKSSETARLIAGSLNVRANTTNNATI